MGRTIKQTAAAALAACLILGMLPAAVSARTVPVATSFSTAVPANRQSLVQLQGSDAEGTSLAYATTSTPAHGTLSNLNASTGFVVYTPAANYTGSDSFTYTVTSGGETSAAGTVTISVTNAKTRVVDFVLDASGSPRSGKVTFILTQVVTSPAGIIPVGSSVSASLSPTGQFDISVYPSRSLNPAAYYQVWFEDTSNLKREQLGVYDIPAATSAVGLSGFKVTDTNLAARYTFASLAGIEAVKNAAANAALTQLMSVSRTTGRLQKWDGTNLSDSLVSESGTTVTINGSLNVTGAITGPVVTTLDNLSDVSVPGPAQGQFLRRGASQWEAAALTSGDVPNLDAGKITSGQFSNARTTATSGNAPNTIVMRDDGGNFNANVITAGKYVGDGGDLTNVGIGTSTGHSATGSVTVMGDNDEDGGGIVDIGTRNEPAIRVNNNGSIDIKGLLGLPSFTFAQLTAPCTPGQITKTSDGPMDVRICREDGQGWRSFLGMGTPWDHGGRGDGSDDAAALQAWANACSTYGIECHLPEANWATGTTIDFDPRVTFRGGSTAYNGSIAANRGSRIRALAAIPILRSLNVTATGQTGVMSSIALNCDGIGTRGLEVQGVVNFQYERMTFRGCTDRGASFQGSLIGSIDKSWFLGNAVGLYIEGGSPQPANLINITGGGFEDNTSWAIDFRGGGGLKGLNVDGERNGTEGVTESGFLRMQNWVGLTQLGLDWDGLHSEGQKGGYLFKLGSPTGAGAPGRVKLRNIIDVEGTGMQDYGVYVESGSGAAPLLVHIEDSVLRSADVADIKTTGVNASVYTESVSYDAKSIFPGSGWNTDVTAGDGTSRQTIFFHDTNAPTVKGAVQEIIAGAGPAASLHIYNNASAVGPTVSRTDTTLPAWRTLYSGPSDNIQDGRCAAGANPCVITTLRTLDNSGNMTLAGGIQLGGAGATLQQMRSSSASLNYATAGAGGCETLTVPVTGIADDGTWTLDYGIPHALMNHNTTATFSVWVSASGVASVRRCVGTADGSDPAAASVRVSARKF